MDNGRTLSTRKIVILIGAYGCVLLFIPLLMYAMFKETMSGLSLTASIPFILLTANIPVVIGSYSPRTRYQVLGLSILPLLLCSIGGTALWSSVFDYVLDWRLVLHSFLLGVPIVAGAGVFVIILTSLKIHRVV